MANIDKKPHLYRINGKWCCRNRRESEVSAVMFTSRDTPRDAFVAWALGLGLGFGEEAAARRAFVFAAAEAGKVMP